MIDLLVEHAGDPGREKLFLQELSAHVAAVKESARARDSSRIDGIEATVKVDPTGAFEFDAQGHANLQAYGSTYSAGRVETPSIGTLRQRAVAARKGKDGGRVRLWVLDGASPATDIGSLQATAGQRTLFQVASQFNCLESPGPYVVPIADYFDDPTQGPRASISAFPGTFLRHYAAPGQDGNRFVQTTEDQQLNLLEAVIAPGLASVQSGYLTSYCIQNPTDFAARLENRFEDIQIGIHERVQVVLGYNWNGLVEGDRHICQVLTSTFAGGGYRAGAESPAFDSIRKSLLRAAYLGTLMAAATVGCSKVVLSLIGGGAFGNPIPLIWESILWAVSEAEQFAAESMHVVVNGRNLGNYISIDELLAEVRIRGGAVVTFGPERVSVRR